MLDKDFIEKLKLMVNEYREDKLPNAKVPFHHEAEISDGLEDFVEYLTEKIKLNKV